VRVQLDTVWLDEPPVGVLVATASRLEQLTLQRGRSDGSGAYPSVDPRIAASSSLRAISFVPP
jgi:hypothetical protein